ncbi:MULTISPECIES: hypothetical protein [Microcystis]|uniref:hypothetical protein n=1 Tax=Microcystis TaxID=1125 RepID=UPI00224827DD|nr:hypothetical protein [Microcystis aeruginosa]UZO79081.1 hypothetical protein M8120_26480 [Microcystis aeruginosa str. Chao 1910]
MGLSRQYLGFAEKVFPGGRVWGVGCGVLPIFREKVPEFSPQSLQSLALSRFLDLFSIPYLV